MNLRKPLWALRASLFAAGRVPLFFVHFEQRESVRRGCIITLGIKGWTGARSCFPSTVQHTAVICAICSHGCCSCRGGSPQPGTTLTFSLRPTATSTSPTPLRTMRASTSAPPPAPWATLAERSSSASTVRRKSHKRLKWRFKNRGFDV